MAGVIPASKHRAIPRESRSQGATVRLLIMLLLDYIDLDIVILPKQLKPGVGIGLPHVLL